MLRPLIVLFVALGAGISTSVSHPANAKTDSALGDICGKRRPCRLVNRKAAGKDAAGRTLAVLKFSLGKSEACERFEHWLLVTPPDGTAERTKLLSLCNDGYASAGVGEDDVVVQPNRFTHSQWGGSAWRWHESTTWQLSPLTTLSSLRYDSWNLASNTSEDVWSWESFKGERQWWSPDCGADGEEREDRGGLPKAGKTWPSARRIPHCCTLPTAGSLPPPPPLEGLVGHWSAALVNHKWRGCNAGFKCLRHFLALRHRAAWNRCRHFKPQLTLPPKQQADGDAVPAANLRDVGTTCGFGK